MASDLPEKYTRYRLLRFPRTLEYRDSVVTLEIVKREHPTLGLPFWMFQARKIGDPGEPLILTFDVVGRRDNLEAKLRHEFSVNDGTPGEKIMMRLVREGFAEIVTGRNPHRWH